MKRLPVYLILILLVAFLGACLKGRIPPEVKLPESRIDSTFLSYFKQTSGVTAGEGTTSLTLSDGRTLWLFGNSHLNDYNSGTGQIACAPNVHNAAMTSDGSFVMTTLNMGSSDFIPSNETGKWFSPLHAYQYADTVFVFAKKSGGSPNTKTYVAKFHFPDLQFIRVDSFYFNNTNYGYTVFLDQAVGFGYVYGLYQPGTLKDNDMYLARFPMNSLHSKWQFYSKTTSSWMDPSSAATSLALIPGENFSIREVKNKFILLTQEYGKMCDKGTKIYSSTAPHPYGNFLNHQLLHTIGDSLNGVTPVTYGVTLHPQFLNAENEVLITYTINGYAPCIPTCTAGFDNPDYYRIRTLRVGLKKIDAAY